MLDSAGLFMNRGVFEMDVQFPILQCFFICKHREESESDVVTFILLIIIVQTIVF